MRQFILLTASVLAFGAGGLSTEALAQTPTEAVAVCANAREPIVRLRDRYREAIRDRTLKGIAVGALGGTALGAAVTANKDKKTQTQAAVIGGVLGAIAGGVNEYVEAKRQIAKDNRELSRLIDSDARGYVGNVNSIASAINAVGKCREAQIATWEQRLISTRTDASARQGARDARLAAATDATERKAIEKANKKEAQGDAKVVQQMGLESRLIQAAIEDDKKLFNDVIKYFDDDIMQLAEAQAMVESTSTASVRGEAEAYVVEVVPPALMANAGNVGSSTSAFGGNGSAFGSAAPATKAATTTTVAAADAAGNGVPPWRASAKRPAAKPENGHQAALIAQRNAQADASVVTQTATARLKYANMKGDEIPVDIKS